MRRQRFISQILAKGSLVPRSTIETVLQEVSEERDLLQVMFDSLLEGIVALSEEGSGILANQAACTLLGLREEEILGENVLDALPEGRFRDLVSDCLDHKKRLLWQEVAIASPVERILSLSVIPIRDRSERHQGTVILFYDITERKISEAELKRAQKLAELTTLSARLSHEIRNPLNNLNIYTQLAERELRHVRSDTGQPGERIERALEELAVVREEIDRLNSVLESFLVAVRPTKPILDEVDPHRLIEATVRILEPELKERKIRVHLSVQESPGVIVLADQVQLRMAVLNLIKNAAEAIGENGEISIEIGFSPGNVEISVRDNGPGIPQELRERIFDPYFTTKDEGSGLGLVTVRRVVEEHGGTVVVRSETGQGTEFILRIPRRRDRSRLIPHKEQAKETGEPIEVNAVPE